MIKLLMDLSDIIHTKLLVDEGGLDI